jgi:hypothetical protein
MDKRNKAPKKTKIGFGVLGLIILAIVTFGGIMLSKSITTKRYDGDIVSFSFHSGSYFGGYGEYEIKNEGGELKFSARGYNGKDVNVDKTISGEYLDRIDAVLKKYDVASWDGFNESDDDVMDGHSFSLDVEYDTGATIHAYGYMKYPRNYNQVSDELYEIIEEILD